MDIGKSLRYMFEDENWITKVLIGGVANLFPIVNLAATGYQVRTIRNVARGDQRPLPEWHDLGNLFVRGLLVAIAGLIYAIPLFFLAAMAILFAALGGAGATGGSAGALGAILMVLAIGVVGLIVFYSLLLSLWLPGATVSYALEGDFAAFFHFGRIWDLISRNLGEYVVALVVAWLAALIAGLIGGAVLFIGAAFTGFWAMLVYAHLFGQVARGPREALP